MEIAGQPPDWDNAYLPTLSLAGDDREQDTKAFRWGAAIATLGLLIGGFAYLSGERTFALIISGGLIGIAIFISPLAGLSLVLIAFAFDAILRLGTDFFTGTKALAIITMVMFILRLPQMQFRNFFRSRPLRFFIALVLLYAVTLLFFIDLYILARLMNLMIWVLMLGLAMLCASIPQNFKQLRVICLAATVGGGLIGLWALAFGVDSLTARGRNIQRLNVGGINENALAFVLGVGLFLSGIAWYGASRKTKAIILFNDLMAIVAIGLSGSRATWLALVVAIILVVPLAKKVKWTQRAAFVLIPTVVGVGGFFIVLKIAPERVEYLVTRVQMIDTEHSGGRMEYIWPKYWETFIENPLLGVGTGVSTIVGWSSHNDILNILASAGLLGFFLFAGLYLMMLRDARRNTVPWLRTVSVAGVIFCFIFGLTHTTMLLKPFAAFVGVMACMTNLGMCPHPGSVEFDSEEYLTPDPALRGGYGPW